MDDRELLKLARQAGFATDESDCPNEKYWFRVQGYGETLAKFAALITADTKERCVRKIDEIDDGEQPAYRHCQEAIRAMKD